MLVSRAPMTSFPHDTLTLMARSQRRGKLVNVHRWKVLSVASINDLKRTFRVVHLQRPRALHVVPVTSFTAKRMTCASTRIGSVMEKGTAQMVRMNWSALQKQTQHPQSVQVTLQIVTLTRVCVCGSLRPLQTWSGYGIVARHPAGKRVQMVTIQLVQVMEERLRFWLMSDHFITLIAAWEILLQGSLSYFVGNEGWVFWLSNEPAVKFQKQ